VKIAGASFFSRFTRSANTMLGDFHRSRHPFSAGCLCRSFNHHSSLSTPLRYSPEMKSLSAVTFGECPRRTEGAIALLTAQGALDDVFDANLSADDDIRCLTVQQDGNVLISGGFTSINGTPRNGIARIFGIPTASRPTLSGVLFRSGTFSCQASTLAGKKYTLQYKDSVELNAWNSFPAVNGDGTTKTFSDSNPPLTHRFYRLLSE